MNSAPSKDTLDHCRQDMAYGTMYGVSEKDNDHADNIRITL